MADAGTTTFYSARRPPLAAGLYRVNASQTMPDSDGTEISLSHAFFVAGPRLELDAALISARQPAANQSGDFDTLLASITFGRCTLPWERIPYDLTTAPEATIESPPPWLALVVMTEDEVTADPWQAVDSTHPERCYLRTIGLSKGQDHALTPATPLAPGITEHFPYLRMEPSDARYMSPTKSVPLRFLSIPANEVSWRIPSPAALTLSAHARSGGDGAEDDVASTLIATRVIRTVTGSDTVYRAFLISLEGYYHHAVDSGDWAIPAVEGANFHTFLVLDAWSFTASAEPGDLVSKAKSLDKNWLRRLPGNDPSAQKISCWLDRGLAALPAIYRDGSQDVAWLRGPLAPDDPQTELDSRLASHALFDSAQLARLDTVSGLLDLSFAAAWDLGRLSAFAATDVARALMVARHTAARADLSDQFSIANAVHKAPPPVDVSAIERWRDSILRLEGLPFNVLVPDPAALPPESLRLFRLDRAWFQAFFRGAGSIGRISGVVDPEDHPLADDQWSVSGHVGLLLRSSLLTHWPNLDYVASAGGKRLKPVRTSRLAPSVLLLLFDSPPDELLLRQPPERMNYGVDLSNGNLVVSTRNKSDGTLTNRTVAIAGASSLRHQAATATRPAVDVIDFAALATALKAGPQEPALTAASLALQLIDTEEDVRLTFDLAGLAAQSAPVKGGI